LHLHRPAIIVVRESKTCEGVATDSAEWSKIREARTPNLRDQPTGQPVAEQLLKGQGGGIATPNRSRPDDKFSSAGRDGLKQRVHLGGIIAGIGVEKYDRVQGLRRH